MAASRAFVILFVFISSATTAQVNRYVVFFKDKANSPYSISQPNQFLSAKSLERRAQQNIQVVEEDLPVNPAYVSEVKSTGARTYFTSRWKNCLLVQIGADSVNLLLALPSVSTVEKVAPGSQLAGGRTKKFKKASASGASSTAAQLQQLGIDEMHNQGFHGEGITIALLDAGFPGVNVATPFQHLFGNNQIKDTFDFNGNTGNVFQYDQHGTEVLSTIGGLIPGSFTGAAYESNFLLFVTEDVPTEYRIEEYNWLFAAERADSAGADVIGTSLGYSEFDDPSMDYSYNDLDGKTALITQAATKAMARGIVVVCSAGNEGSLAWHYITPPSDAINILSCAAVNAGGERVAFSSVGPSADGRIKPDVASRGYATAVILPSGTIGAANGTSFSSPLISGLVAGVLQSARLGNKSYTVQKVYDAIIHSADQAYHPDNQRGYGIPNFTGVNNYLKAKELVEWVEIYPNPVTSSAMNIALKEPEGEELAITLYDQLGKMISDTAVFVTWENNPLQMNMDGMSPGIYFLRVKSKELTKTFKWAKL